MKRFTYLFVLALLFTSLSVSAQKIVFTPQWTAQSQFAGYYVALEKGFYKEAGVDVEFVHPSASYPAINRLVDGSSSVISMQLMQAIAETGNGTELINILQTSQHNGLVVVSRGDTLNSLYALGGKKVGIWRAGFGELALLVDKELQLGIEWIPFIQNVDLFLSGAIDATLAMIYNEYLQIFSSGFEKSPVLRLSETGFDIPEDGLYVTKEFYNAFPEQVKKFAEASRKGWEYVHKYPEEALEITFRMMEKENVPINKIHQEWMLKEILELQKNTPQGKATFDLDLQKVEQAIEIMLKHNFIGVNITAKVISDKYIVELSKERR